MSDLMTLRADLMTLRADLMTLRANLPEYRGQTCGPYSAGDFDGTPEAVEVEALMMIVQCTKDIAGLLVLPRLPAAAAVAIIRAYKSGDVVEFARDLVAKEMPYAAFEQP